MNGFRLGLDSEKNGALVPPPVPSPPPVIEPSPFQFPTKNESKANNNSGPAAGNNMNADHPPLNRNDYRDERGGNGNFGRDGRDGMGRDPMNRNDRDRDMDRGGDWHRRGGDNDGGNAWHRRDNGYGGYQNRGYQPRSNYGPLNHDRPMNNYQVTNGHWKIFYG